MSDTALVDPATIKGWGVDADPRGKAVWATFSAAG